MPLDPATDIDTGGDIQGNAYAPGGSDILRQQDLQDYSDRQMGIPTPGYTPRYTPGATEPALSFRALTPRHQVPEWQPGGTFQPYDLGPTTAPETTGKGGVGWNLYSAFENAVDALGSSAVGLGRAVNAYTAASPWADEVMTGMQQSIADRIQHNIEGRGPSGQFAAKASIARSLGLGPTTDENGEDIPGIFDRGAKGFAAWAADRIAGFVPYGVAMMIPGLGEAGTAALFGAQSIGDAATAQINALNRVNDASYQRDNPVYRQLRQVQGMSEQQAKLEMAKGAWASLLAAGVIGAGTGYVGGRLFGSGAIGASAWSPAMRRAWGAVEGGSVGALYSGGQSAAEQYGEKTLGLRPDVDVSEALREALAGGVGGAILGGTFGARQPDVRTAKEPDVDQQAALEQPPPGGPAPPSTEPPGPSGPSGPLTTADMSGIPGWSPTGVQTIPRTPARAPEPPPVSAAEPIGIPGWSPPTEPVAGPHIPPTVEQQPPATQQAIATSKARAEAPAAPAPAPTPEVQPVAARPSEGMSRGDLISALEGMGLNRQTLNRMSAGDLATRFDKLNPAPAAETPAGQPVAPITTEVRAAPGAQPAERAPAPAPVTAEAAAEVAPPEAPAQVGSVPVLPAGEAALEHLAAVTRGVADLPKKSPNAVAIRKAMDELQRAFSDAKSEADVLTHLREAQKGREGETGQVALIRRNLAAAIESRITGEKPAFERTIEARRAEEAAAHEARERAATPIEEVQREEQERGGAEAVSPESIEAKATGEGAGGQTMGLEPVQARVRKTTDLKVIGRQLLEKVLDETDPTTAKEAAERFDRRMAGPGRPRREETASFQRIVEDELKRVDDPEKRTKLQEKLRDALISESGQEEPGDLSRRLEKTLEDYAPSRIEKLRDVLREIVDPVGQATREQARARVQAAIAARKGDVVETEHRVPTTDGISPRSSRYVDMSRDQRLGESMVRAIRASEEHGVPFTLRDALGLVTRDPLVHAEARPFRMLATQMLRLLGREDVPIYSNEQARELGLNPAQGYGVARMNLRDPSANHIVLNISGEHQHGTHLGTVLHEGMHVITSRYLHELRLRDPNHPDIQVLKAIGRELMGHVDQEGMELWGREKESLLNALSNMDELHTTLMSDPTVQAFAASRVASPEFRAELSRLGYAPREQGRSVWRYFTDWVRRALGLRTPASASEYTMLDHVLRPMQDIAERAAVHNERYLPKDPALRRGAVPMSDGFSNAFSPREVADRALERADFPGVGDRARQALLASATSDGIVNRYTRILSSLPGWRTASEAIAASARRFVNSAHGYDKVQELTRRYRQADNPGELGRIMNEVGYLDAQLGPGADNAHLTTPEEKSSLATLQARFDKLSPGDRKLYADMKDNYRAWYDQERTARLNHWIDTFMPDATPAQRGEMQRISGDRDAMERYINNQDNTPTARSIAKLQLLTHVDGDYFPLRRFGKYVLTHGDPDEPANYGVEFFERRSEAQARAAELRAANAADVRFGLKRQYASRDLAPSHPFVDDMISRLADRGYDQYQRQEVRDLINSVLVQHATSGEAQRAVYTMRRQGVRGAATDHARILAHEFLAMQGRIGYLEHGAERAQALHDLREEARQAERTGEGVKAQQVVQEIEKRSSTIEDIDNPLQRMAAKANIWSFAQSLMSPSHMLTSSMEAHTNSLALLGARYGYARASLALTRALMHTSPALKEGAMNTIRAVRGSLKQNNWNILNVLRDRLIANGAHKPGMEALIARLEEAGLVDHTALNDMRLMANPSGVTGGRAAQLWNWFYNVNAASAHSVDAMNKLAIAKAAFDLHYKSTGNWREAVDQAVDFTRKAMPNYNLANKPRVATQRGILGPFGAPLMQFKNYGLHMYTMMANLAHDALSSAKTPEERWVATKGFAGLLATHAMMAGVITLIADPLRYIGGAYDALTGAAKPHNYENDVRSFITETFGPELGELISRGLPHAVGIDVHGRVGLANLLEIPEMNSFDKEGAGQVLLGLATGATGENLQASWGGFTKLLQGDLSGLTGLAPRPIRDAMKAADLEEKGITDSKGKTVLPPEKLHAGATVAQALGFQPAQVSEFREGRNAVLEAREEAQSARTRLVQQWLAAEPIDRAAIMTQIREFNADPKHRGMTITADQLHKDLEAQRKQAKAPFGLRLPAKASRTLSEAGAFANYQ